MDTKVVFKKDDIQEIVALLHESLIVFLLPFLFIGQMSAAPIQKICLIDY